MKQTTLLLIFTIGTLFKCHAQSDFFFHLEGHIYESTVRNDETNSTDTFTIDLCTDKTFTFYKKGVEGSGLRMKGFWIIKGDTLILQNKYPSSQHLKVRVLPVKDSCNPYFPDMINNSGEIAYDFFMDANNYTFSSGMRIPYTELDSLKNKVRICSNGGSFCSDVFAIPYKDCYQIIVDIDIDPKVYDGRFKDLYFKTNGNSLILIGQQAN